MNVANGSIYKMIWEEEIALQRYLEENLPTGKIWWSWSVVGTPILFMNKKDGSLRLCVDYRGLNNFTISNKYPLLLIHELLECTQRATWFTKLDIKNSYNLIRIASRDEWKTAFNRKEGLFEYTVILFGLLMLPHHFRKWWIPSSVTSRMLTFCGIWMICLFMEVTPRQSITRLWKKYWEGVSSMA